MGVFGARSIADKGGLKPHLESLGIDYGLFITLIGTGLDNAAIATALSKDRPKKIKSVTVKGWRKYL
jgi:hypothetical protein